VNNREVDFKRNSYSIWAAGSPDGKEHYLAMFNLEDSPMQLSADLKELGIINVDTIEDIWTGESEKILNKKVKYEIKPHGVKYLMIK
jgi:hypothetical protein